MLTIKGLNTHYGASHVLQGVDLIVPAGPHLFGAWPQWRRQDDDLAHRDGTGAAEWWARAAGWRRHHRLAAAPRRARRRRLCAGGPPDLSRSHRGGEHPCRRAPDVAVPGPCRG